LAFGIEDNSYAAKTYRSNFPEATVLEKDVRNVLGSEIRLMLDERFPRGQKTILVGGPPCQPFSYANRQQKRFGAGHPSASAVEHFWRLIREVGPDAFLFENVVTFETIDGGSSLRSLVEATEQLGFSVSVTKLDAKNFGVPQRRRRLFVGGVRGITGFEIPDVTSKDLHVGKERSDDLQEVTVRDAISDLPRLPRGGGGREVIEYEEPSRNDLCVYQKAARANASKLCNHWSSKHGEPVMETFRYIKTGSSLIEVWDILPQRISERYGNKDSIQSNIYRRLSWGSLSPTVVHPRRAMLIHPKQNRIISVREAARLQGFPDSFRFCGSLDSQYQQVANAVPPPMAEFLGQHFRRQLCHNP